MSYPSTEEQIKNIVERAQRIKPVVLINTLTFNHKDYLRDTLDGFIMQKTDFPFVAVVHDDASTDGTTAILHEYAEKYPDIILPIFENENQYSKRDGSLSKIIRTVREGIGAKYIALCEGDDYWTNPLKLQKQVDFLETHPEYTLVAHNCLEIWTDGSRAPKPYRILESGDVTGLEIFKFYPFQTATLLFRKEIPTSEKYNKKYDYKILSNDKWLMMTCSYYGKVYCLGDIMSVYRRHASGMSFDNRNNRRMEGIIERWYYGNEFGPEISDYSNKYMTEALIEQFLIRLRLFQLSSSLEVIRTFNKYCNKDIITVTRAFIKQLSYFKPFKYLFHRN